MATVYGAGARTYAAVLDPSLRPAHERIVELAGVTPGERVLDLATGTGAIARVAAGAGATVIGVDISPGMIEMAASLSDEGVRFRVADVTALPFGAASFDAITCGFGLSHVSDPAKALAEVRRCLAPGGRFIDASWGAQSSSPAFSAVLSSLKPYARDRLHALSLDEDTWADPGTGSEVLRSAGFDSVVSTSGRLEGQFTSADAAVEWTLAWPDYGETFAALTGHDKERFLEESRTVLAGVDLEWWFEINYYCCSVGADRP